MSEFKLIMCMGAEHVRPEKLKQIIEIINADNYGAYDINQCVNIDELVHDVYGVDTSNIDTDWYTTNRYIVEEKYDGYSYLNDGGRFYSKRLSQAKGNEGMPVEKTGHMPHLSSILKIAYEQCGCDLHGELYVPGGISDDVTKILGCTEDEAVRRTMENINKYGINSALHYRLIDIRKYNDIDVTCQQYYVRRILLEHVYNTFIRPLDADGFIDLTEVLRGDPRDHFKRIVNSGGEGIIMKRTNALYIPGKKPTDNWVKGKKKVTHDVVIMGFNDGTGKNKSLFGSIKFGHYIDGKLTPCGSCSSGLNDATRAMIAADPDSYIGTVIEIEAIQESVKSFRNAVFIRLRDDKSAEECTPLNIIVKDELI